MQKRLPSEVIEGLLGVPMRQSRRGLGQSGRHRDLGHRCGRFRGSRLVDLVQATRPHLGNPADPTRPPANLQAHRGGTRGEHADRFAVRQVLTSRHDLLRLDHRSALQADLRTHAVGITRAPLESHRDPGRGAAVAEHQRRTIERIGHHIEVAILVQVHRDHAVGRFGGIEAPGRAGLLEGEVPAIAEGVLRRCQRRVLQEQIPRGLYGLMGRRFRTTRHIAVVHVVQMTVGDEEVFPSVEVHIEEEGGPRPSARRHSGGQRNLRPGPVTPVPVEAVARNILPGRKDPRRPLHRRHRTGGAQVLGQLAPMHLHGDKVEIPVAVEVREIHPHRRIAHRAQGPGIRCPKTPPAIAKPQAVRGLEVIADVNVRVSVAVDVPHLNRQPEILRSAHGLAVGIQEGLFPGGGLEATFPVIDPQDIRVSEFHHEAVDHLHPVGMAAGDHRLPIDHAGGDEGPIAQDGLDREIAAVHVEIAVAIDVGQRHRRGARLAREAGFDGHIPEATLSIVDQAGIRSAKARDEQIRGSVAVQVAEHGTDRSLLEALDPRRSGDVFETTVPPVPIEPIAGLLVAEEQVHQPIAVHIGRRQTRSIHQVLELRDPVGRQGIGESDTQGSGGFPGKTRTSGADRGGQWFPAESRAGRPGGQARQGHAQQPDRKGCLHGVRVGLRPIRHPRVNPLSRRCGPGLASGLPPPVAYPGGFSGPSRRR